MKSNAVTHALMVTVTVMVLAAAAVAWFLGVFRSTAVMDAVALATPEPLHSVEPEPEPLRLTIERDYSENTRKVYLVSEDNVDVFSDGYALFALPDAQCAENLIRDYFYGFTEPSSANERLLVARLDASITLRPASGKYPLLSPEEAMQKLTANQQLVPVSCLINRAEISDDVPLTEMANLAALQSGVRLVESYGVGKRRLSFVEISYTAGIELALRETHSFTLWESEPRLIRVGALRDSAASDAGPTGKSNKRLGLHSPMKGFIRSYFGWHGNVMNNGVDIYATPGTRILAPASGTVIFCGPRGDYGFVIDIQLADPSFVVRLAHCDNARVKLYQHVERGEFIALLSDALGENAFLHFELLIDGIPYNPVKNI